MHKDLFPHLNAYLDGELHGARLRHMEHHLTECEICRTELADLRRVSDLLRAAPSPEFTPADRFASNLTLSLPRHPHRSQPRRATNWVWWLVPAGLIGLLFFVQTVFAVANLVHVANIGGLFDQSTLSLADAPSQTAWFTVASTVFGANLSGGEQSALSALNGIEVFSADLFQELFWQAGILLAGLVWLVLWQARHNAPPVSIEIEQ